VFSWAVAVRLVARAFSHGVYFVARKNPPA
jgi:hypothetical protein